MSKTSRSRFASLIVPECTCAQGFSKVLRLVLRQIGNRGQCTDTPVFAKRRSGPVVQLRMERGRSRPRVPEAVAMESSLMIGSRG